MSKKYIVELEITTGLWVEDAIEFVSHNIHAIREIRKVFGLSCNDAKALTDGVGKCGRVTFILNVEQIKHILFESEMRSSTWILEDKTVFYPLNIYSVKEFAVPDLPDYSNHAEVSA
jgi:hypothetical protein